MGKTVLLNEIERLAQADGYKTILVEAHEDKSLAALLAPELRRLLFSLDRMGPYRSGEIADMMRVKVTSLGPVRADFIKKGMIYSPSHGEIAFTVPLFDNFMRRSIP